PCHARRRTSPPRSPGRHRPRRPPTSRTGWPVPGPSTVAARPAGPHGWSVTSPRTLLVLFGLFAGGLPARTTRGRWGRGRGRQARGHGRHRRHGRPRRLRRRGRRLGDQVVVGAVAPRRGLVVFVF